MIDLPFVGYGTCDVNDKEVVKAAIKSGYRLIDTAAHYFNESIVGEAIRESEISRLEFCISTKLWYSDMGYENAIRAFYESLEKLGINYIDIYLIHWPAALPQYPNWKEVNADTWRALEKLYKDGAVKAIGTSNFLVKHMSELLKTCEIKPMINQIENHIGFFHKDEADFCKTNNIALMAWQPLGGSEVLNNEVIKKMAQKYCKSPAQICLRWNYQHGFISIPKTVTRSRMYENLDIFSFDISQTDMEQLDRLPQCGGQCAIVR